MVEEQHDHICWGGGHHHHGGHTLTIEQLSAHYGAHKALDNIQLSAHCGQTLALIGPNGAGKSTLINLLAGLMRPVSGQILWNGAPLHETRHEIAFMPQRSEVDRNFPITVRELVEMGRYPSTGLWKPMRRHDRDIVDKALTALDLQDLQNRQIGALSGGQQQRAFLARALAQEAHILLLDEPFTGLDVPGTESLASLLRTLAAEGRLVIASHHDLNTAAQIFDFTLLLNRSAIAYGPTTSVLTAENLHTAFGQRTITTTP
ncbi:MAG: metal ABC transporter ATP-binding protein [Akkermansia sp.]|nr:metal ABC transporter ATP-binding protein [Akkermansia sp.]